MTKTNEEAHAIHTIIQSILDMTNEGETLCEENFNISPMIIEYWNEDYDEYDASLEQFLNVKLPKRRALQCRSCQRLFSWTIRKKMIWKQSNPLAYHYMININHFLKNINLYLNELIETDPRRGRSRRLATYDDRWL